MSAAASWPCSPLCSEETGSAAKEPTQTDDRLGHDNSIPRFSKVRWRPRMDEKVREDDQAAHWKRSFCE